MATSTKTLPFTSIALEKTLSVLSTVGLTEEYGFPHHAQDPEGYRFGGLEWSERSFGTRFYLDLNHKGRVNRILVVNLYGRASGPVSEERLAEVNAELAQILADHN